MEKMKKIIIADTSEEHRKALATYIQSEDDMVVVGETTEGAELLKLVEDHNPDAIIMDLVLTGLDGLEVLTELKGYSNPPQILIYS
ncbi:MAG: response regulator transcription factor, partial [Eubacteriales bacterium]